MKILHVFTIINTPRSFFDGQFKFLHDNGQEIHVATASPEDEAFSQRNNIIYTQMPIQRKMAPMADLSSIKTLIQLIRKEKFDVVIGHTPKGAMVAMVAAKLAGIKKRVYYRHGLVYTTAKGLKRNILQTVERLTSAFATHIVNVSNSLCHLAITDHLNTEKKQRVIGSGTCGGIDTTDLFNPALISDLEKSKLRTTLELKDEDFVVGFCGRICKDKGIRELVDGFNLFRGTHPKSKLLLVGRYDDRDILPEEYKYEIECNPNIIETGGIDRKKLPLYYSLMDVIVLPSYREGFGMCVIEASAMQVPILVSRSHGCIDTIKENVTGEYIEICAEGVAKGLEEMLDEEKRQKYGNNGRNWVTENFDHSVVWPKIKEFYTEILKDKTHS